MNPMVLVVEDEDALATLLDYNLEKEGYRVSAANDGEEGLAMLKEHKPDLLVLDWMLPHVSGIEICRQIRRKSELRDLPVIMLTARGEEADRVRGLEVGLRHLRAVGFVPAPDHRPAQPQAEFARRAHRIEQQSRVGLECLRVRQWSGPPRGRLGN